ncbi:hypothetical protein HJD18_11525 [Thermoleophilia bacterium SCSIO 60948]|nr:hypothetical protein HJD18_11525 [Thermoleophilia bacterium SCSIO 60948]
MSSPAAETGADGAPEPIPDYPSTGRSFESERRVELGDCDPSGRARLDAVARWLQDVAYEDVTDAGMRSEGVWVVRRLRLRVEGFPGFGEPIALRTACSAFGRLVAERRTDVSAPRSGARIAAVALWVHLDPETRLPARLGEEFDRIYAPSAAGRRARSGLHHDAEAPAGAVTREWFFRRADLDLAGHVNNASYWAIAEELLGDASLERLDAEIEFRDGIGAGAARVAVAGGSVRVLDVAGSTLAASIELGVPGSAAPA